MRRWIYRSLVKLVRRMAGVQNVYVIDSVKLQNMLVEAGDIKQLILWDGRYKFTDFETMKRIIDLDWTEEAKYKLEEFDCDNFAMAFASHVAEFYGINAVGIAVGRIHDVETGEYLGYHAWNVFLAMKRDGNPRLYVYEPQSGRFTDYKYARIGNWKYVPEYIIWG